MEKSILVVDDEEPIQDLIRVYLTPLGVRIHSAYTGEDGVKRYQEMLEAGRPPDLVLMDLKLPGIDGIQTINYIMDLDPAAVIYGFTAFSRSVWAADMLHAGARKVIPRAIGFSGLREIIREELLASKVMANNHA